MCKTILIAAILLFGNFSSASQEKIYIQYNKDSYSPGETIWFKAYIRNGGLPSNNSNNFYLLLSDKKGKSVAFKKYPVIASSATGDIILPAALNEGIYTITAATGPILNDSFPQIYKRNIFVSDGSAATKPGIKAGNELHLVFYPEGGKMINGIQTTVGFKATDERGRPVDTKGKILSGEGTGILSFASSHDGMGRFEFRPQAGKQYIAEVETATGLKKYALPPVFPSGVSLRVQDEQSGKKILIMRSGIADNPSDSLILTASINGQVVYNKEFSWEGYSSAVSHVLTDSLPSGILQFVLYDKRMTPLAERISFVDNGEYRSAPLFQVNKVNTGTDKRHSFNFIFPDEATRICSISVTEYQQEQPPDEENIWSQLLLTSGLSEPVNNPAWYFERENSSNEKEAEFKKLAADNLMLTSKLLPVVKIEPGNLSAKKIEDPFLININGLVLNEATKKPVKEGLLVIFFSASDSSLLSYNLPVNAGGRFSADSLDIAGPVKVYYTYKDKRGDEIPVIVMPDEDTSAKTIMKKLSYYGGTSEKTLADNIAMMGKPGNPEAKLLENVVVVASQKRPIDIINEKYTSEIFRTGGKIKIDNINFPPADKAMNGLDFVLNRITTIGVQYGTFVNRKNFSLQDNRDKRAPRVGINTTTSGPMRYWEVGLFINEIPADLIQLKVLRADQIAMVKFFEAGALGSGSVYPGGAIVVYLNYETSPPRKTTQMKYFNCSGYSVTKEFSLPTTNLHPGEAVNKEGNRTTFYWNPDIYIDNTSNTAQVRFYVNDFSRKIKIVLTGIDNNGRLIYFEKIIDGNE